MYIVPINKYTIMKAINGYWREVDTYDYACKWGDFITTGKTRMECINKMLEIAKEL